MTLWLSAAGPAVAQSVVDYFKFSYEPVVFSQTEIQGGELFYATVQGQAICTQDLPIAINEATVTSRVIAEHARSGTPVIINSSYTITINPFPSKKGQLAEINQEVPLQFPAGAEAGDYNVIGVLVEAKVKVSVAWMEVTQYLPQNNPMGSIKYTAPEPVTTATPETTPVPPPPPAPAVETEAALPEYIIPGWVWLLVTLAIATTIMNLVWFLRQRAALNRPDSV